MREKIGAIEEKAEEWCREMREKGIDCEFLLDRKSISIPDSILSAIRRKKVGRVAMVSTVGRVGAVILGSATREVLRNSPVPVWVVHPGNEASSETPKVFEKRGTGEQKKIPHRGGLNRPR
jgi:nucleotide-binding universal stress UspA family protein